MRLTGSSDGTRYVSRGELDLDSLTFKNFQFTRITGPLWFDNNTVVFGDWGPQFRPAGQPARRAGHPPQAGHSQFQFVAKVRHGGCRRREGNASH